jgi:hypothetical protein
VCLYFSQVERVIAERPGQSRSLLVKWEGLPYCEATWEAAEDVMAAQGGPEARDDFLTRQQRLQVRMRHVHVWMSVNCSASTTNTLHRTPRGLLRL